MVTYKFNQNVAKKFMDLPINGDKTSLTYVWIDGSGQSLRSKTKTVNILEVNQPSTWDFCASGVGFNEFREAKEAEEAEKAQEAKQTKAEKNDETQESKESDEPGKAYEDEKSKKSKVHSSCELRPCSIYNDPFLGGNAKLVLCDVYYQDKPVATNSRKKCLEILNEKVKLGKDSEQGSVSKTEYFEPVFGIEQEYTLIDPKTDRPLGWPESGFPAPQGPYYLGVGTGSAIGRDIAEAHYRACQYANIPIYGYNAEVMPGQWEFQVGECKGIKMGDDLWMARFILVRLAEEFGVKVSFDPKPVEGDWNGAGAHINFSTNETRAENGILKIHKMIKNLEKHHNEAITVYDPNGGKDNARRLSGKHETSKIDEFTWGFDDRFASIRISRSVEKARKGYFEDRRPASNADPYKVMTHLLEICCNNS